MKTLSTLTKQKVKLQQELAAIEKEIDDFKENDTSYYLGVLIDIHPIQETGSGRTGTLNISYDEIIAKVGKPNATKLDDPDKVKASWGFQDNLKRKGFIWSYKVPSRNVKSNTYWSTDGDKNLLVHLFGNAYTYEG